MPPHQNPTLNKEGPDCSEPSLWWEAVGLHPASPPTSKSRLPALPGNGFGGFAFFGTSENPFRFSFRASPLGLPGAGFPSISRGGFPASYPVTLKPRPYHPHPEGIKRHGRSFNPA